MRNNLRRVSSEFIFMALDRFLSAKLRNTVRESSHWCNQIPTFVMIRPKSSAVMDF